MYGSHHHFVNSGRIPGNSSRKHTTTEQPVAHKFDPTHLEHLNDPVRLERVNPRTIWQALDLQAQPRTIVDLGAGTGLYSLEFAALAPSATVFACDVAEPMVAWMTENLSPGDLEHIRPTLVAESSLGLPPAAVDLVILIQVLHELEHADATLQDIREVLRPGGTVAIIDYHKRETGSGPPVGHRISSADARSLVESAGFREIRHCDEIPGCYILIARTATP